MRWAFIIFALASQVWAAGYVEWQPVYNLWMPAISANSSAVMLSKPNQQLPFAEPAPVFSSSPMFKKVPFDPTNALIMDQKYFSSDAPVLEKTTVILKIPSFSKDNFRIEGLSTSAVLPTHLILIKREGEVTVLGDWPANVLPGDRDLLMQGAKKALETAADGQYGSQVHFE